MDYMFLFLMIFLSFLKIAASHQTTSSKSILSDSEINPCKDHYDNVCKVVNKETYTDELKRVGRNIIRRYSDDYYANFWRRVESQDKLKFGTVAELQKALLNRCGGDELFVQKYFQLTRSGNARSCEKQAEHIAECVHCNATKEKFSKMKMRFRHLDETHALYKYLESEESSEFKHHQNLSMDLFALGKRILLEKIENDTKIVVPAYKERLIEKLKEVKLYYWGEEPQSLPLILKEIQHKFDHCTNRSLNMFEVERQFCFTYAFESSLDKYIDHFSTHVLSAFQDGPLKDNAKYTESANEIIIQPLYSFHPISNVYDHVGLTGKVLLHELGHVIFSARQINTNVSNCIAKRTNEECAKWGKNRGNCNSGHQTITEDFCDWISDSLAIEAIKEMTKRGTTGDEFNSQLRANIFVYYRANAYFTCSKLNNLPRDHTHSPSYIRVNAILGRTHIYRKLMGCPAVQGEKANNCGIF